ncbi:MAG TPA: class I SAM-dependent methyltransferase [Acetivibrio sp.]|uniref:class I SAM-dependent methyltransferase n=1 Tax=Acetivibrio sp. TaxID=1872092 RepID=UPI002C573D86|nr:class I SAM-dependent methyltransferase [Acetivibrio sp.]HOM01296.1 class I SAM-dependent methyltransferase [Acetivibrio sp.]
MNLEFENTKKFWGAEIARANLIWPDENVLRFVKRNYKPGSIILDYGCGAGRNAIALSKEGYSCIAMDYTKEALDLVRHKSMEENLSIRIVKNTGFEVPLEENSVDGIIAVGSLFYNRKSDNVKILANLAKVLKPGGKIWANWRTKRDHLFVRGIDMGEGLYKLETGTGREGCCYFFADEKDIIEMYEMSELSIEMLDDYEYTENNRTILNSYYHVVAKK